MIALLSVDLINVPGIIWLDIHYIFYGSVVATNFQTNQLCFKIQTSFLFFFKLHISSRFLDWTSRLFSPLKFRLSSFLSKFRCPFSKIRYLFLKIKYPFFLFLKIQISWHCWSSLTNKEKSCASALSHWQPSSQDELCCPLQVLPAAVQLRTQRGPSWPTRVSQLTEVGALLIFKVVWYLILYYSSPSFSPGSHYQDVTIWPNAPLKTADSSTIDLSFP